MFFSLYYSLIFLSVECVMDGLILLVFLFNSEFLLGMCMFLKLNILITFINYIYAALSLFIGSLLQYHVLDS